MKSTFILGEEWLYFKFYCGKRTADIILIEAIKPLTEKLIQNKLIDKWFFIRYSDPKHHLRIRFNCPDILKIGIIIHEIKETISYFVEQELIWKVQVDTYQRELERYGKNTIDQTEQFFYYDSITCINALNLIEDDTIVFLFTLKSIDDLLNVFDLNMKQKLEFTKPNLSGFKKEFNSNKLLSKQLSKKYELLKKEGDDFLTMKEHEDYDSLIVFLKEKRDRLLIIKEVILKLNSNHKLEVSINNLLSSYIHMMVNRMFRDKQRLHELVCYDFLFRYYNGILARKDIISLD